METEHIIISQKLKGLYEQFYNNKLDNLEELDKFPEMYTLLR